ncbi:MAG: hypothetical protein ACLTDF_10640 [Coprococcus sp.]
MISSAMQHSIRTAAVPVDLVDLTSQNGRYLGDIFGDMFEEQVVREIQMAYEGCNIKTTIRVGFEEAIFGTQKELELPLKDDVMYVRVLIPAGTSAGSMQAVWRQGTDSYNTAVTVWSCP